MPCLAFVPLSWEAVAAKTPLVLEGRQKRLVATHIPFREVQAQTKQPEHYVVAWTREAVDQAVMFDSKQAPKDVLGDFDCKGYDDYDVNVQQNDQLSRQKCQQANGFDTTVCYSEKFNKLQLDMHMRH